MKTAGVYIVSLLIFLLGCTLEPDPTSNQSTSDYTNYKVGNYWVYEETKYDSNQGILSSSYDLVSVEGIESRNGHDYFIVTGHAIGTNLLYKHLVRDSSNHLVDSDGRILVAYEVTGKPLKVHAFPPHYYTATTMQAEAEINIGPRAFQDILNAQDQVTIKDPSLASNLSEIIYNDHQFAKGVGLVRERVTTISKVVNITYERRLVRCGNSD